MRDHILIPALFIIIVTAAVAFAETPQGNKISPKTIEIREGMSKEDLYKAYPAKYRLQDHVRGSMEIIMFDDYLTGTAGDTITFYFKNGKLDWWDKVQVNITPEERLEAVLNRSSHAQIGGPSGRSEIDPNIIFIKRSDRADNFGSSNIKKYYKGVR